MRTGSSGQLQAALARHRTAILATAAALSLAWLLTKTSTSLLGNLPLAVLVVVSLRAGFSCLERQQRAKLRDARDARAWRSEAPPTTPAPTFGVPPSAAKPDSWRKYVRAPVVEEAWAKFCGSIVQEFLYDTWYKSITPDKEFPAEVRRLLNTAFGQLAHRARRLDLRLAMDDLSELFMEQLELFRDTRESILAATQQPNCLRDMHAAARDRAFQREMKAENNLHPALLQPEGHYKFLKAVSEGAVAYLLDESDLQRPAARVVCRELLASCVFRPLMGWATPYYFNKALHALLREAQQKRAARQKEAAEVSAALAAVRSQQMRGHFEFEERLREHSAAEDKALLAAKELRHRLRRKLSQHTRSRSADMLHDKQGGQAQQAEQRQQERSQHRQRDDERAHSRARSSSPVELAVSRSQQQGGAAKPSESTGSTGGAGSLQRDRSFGGGQLRPPRPPALQQGQGGERSPSDASYLVSAVAATPVPGSTTPQQGRQRAGSSGQETPRLPSSGWRLPDVIGGLLPGGRQSADAEEVAVQGAREGEGDGWESVEASEASLNLLPRRDFSAAHLLAPSVDRQAVASVTPRVTSNSSDASGSPRPGFVGVARAKVVAADLNTSSSKDFVEFKIRVADDAEEWTVSRRYRNFESLHRQLRSNPAYRLKLPPKRIFVHSNNVEFVEERREQLDRYLQALLAHRLLSRTPELFDFLRKGSELYELAPARNQKSTMFRRTFSTGPTSPQPPAQQRTALGGLSRAVLDGTQTVGRGITSASGAVAGSVRQGVSELASVASGGVAKVGSGVAGAAGAVVGAFAGPGSYEQQPGLTRRVKSVPFGLDRVSGSSSESLAAVPRGSSGSALTRDKGSLLGRAGTLIRSAMGKDAAAVQLDHSGHSGSSASVHDEHAAVAVGGFMLSGSPAKKASKLFSGLRRSKSRSASPSKGRERSPSRRPRRGEGGSATASRRNSGEVPAASLGQSGAGGSLPAHVVSSLRSASLEPSSPPLASFPVEPAADLEDCSGVSDPLYDCIDCLFQLQTRGFFRRQVFAVARQALSLVAGEAIDAYLTSKLRLLRQQHTIGRIISQIQASLWPGGVWFQYTPAAQAAAAARERQHALAAAAGTYVRPEGMAAAKFLEPSGPPPLDEDEIREAVEALLLRRAPAALVRLIGKNAYASGMLDMFDMLQSQTFCHHLGYGCLEICMVHLFPELKSLFRTLQHGGLD